MLNAGTRTTLASLPLLAAGCDPVIDLQGTFFPAWLLCMIAGVVLTVALRPVFVRLGLEPYLGPLPLIYTSLAVLLTLGTWLVFFRT
ncbi:MAG: YtcA family lipoprotein [Thermodesulfobacteriota bacterium]